MIPSVLILLGFAAGVADDDSVPHVDCGGVGDEFVDHVDANCATELVAHVSCVFYTPPVTPGVGDEFLIYNVQRSGVLGFGVSRIDVPLEEDDFEPPIGPPPTKDKVQNPPNLGDTKKKIIGGARVVDVTLFDPPGILRDSLSGPSVGGTP